MANNEPAGREKLLAPRMIVLTSVQPHPQMLSNYSVEVPLIDAIAAVQKAGYLVYEIGELPKVTEDANGKPKLPPRQTWNDTRPAPVRFYEEAFDKLALARWYEAEAVRRQKRVAALANDLEQTLQHNDMEAFAASLVERGWRK